MASDVEGLYAAVKALVCVVKSNPLASKEMERIRGYQVCKKYLKTDWICSISVSLLAIPMGIPCCVAVALVYALGFTKLLAV